MKNLISILFSIIGFQSLSSQALVTSIDNDTIIIGKNVKYIIKLENDKEERVVFPDSTSFTSLEYVSDDKIDTIIENNKFIYSKKYDLTSFDEGSFIIPKMSVMVGDQILLTESKTIKVNLVEVDTLKQGLYEIKPIYDDIKYFNYTILYILLVVVVTSLVIYFFRKSIYSYFNPILKLIPSDSSLDEIKENILNLKNLELNSQIEIKLMYSKMTYLIRCFLLRDIFGKSLESTSQELIDELNKLKTLKKFAFTNNTISKIDGIFKRADLVKFAKFKPEREVIINDINNVYKELEKIQKLVPEPSEAEKLRNLNYQKELLKKQKNKRIKNSILSVVGLFLIVFLFSSIAFGFQFTIDKILFNENQKLLNSKWVKSEYGNPGIILETPEPLIRSKNEIFIFEDFISESHFYTSNNDKSLELFAINYSTNNKIDPNNFQQILELSLDKLESYGLQNFLVKYDNFESNNGAKGLIISGDTDFLDEKKNIKKGSYKVIGFLSQTGFKKIIILNHDKRYVREIIERIVSSIELLKEKKR